MHGNFSWKLKEKIIQIFIKMNKDGNFSDKFKINFYTDKC